MLKRKTESFYGEKFDFAISDYHDADYSKIAVILPGQGSLDLQQVTSEIRHIPSCTELYKRADQWAEAVGLFKISSVPAMSFKSTSEEFMYKNIYLFTLTVGLFDFLKKSGRDIEHITSHSFGECAALVCSGLVSFEDGLQIVKWREESSPDPGALGTLLALSCNQGEVASCLEVEGVYLANINSKNQTVLAVSMESLAKVKSHLKKLKIPVVELKAVGRPYHSPLMQKAADTLKGHILNSSITVQSQTNSFLSSVRQEIYSVGSVWTLQGLAELMADQLTKPVLFDRQIETLQTQGIHSYLELGFSGIYLGFVENILGAGKVSTQSMRWLCKRSDDKLGNKVWTFDVQNSPFLGVLRKYINKVTGYDVLDIQIHDQFQEDLRIDSIKKAEIVFKTLEELNLSIEESLRLAQLRSVGDIVDFLEGLKVKPVKAKKEKKVEFHIHQAEWKALPLMDLKIANSVVPITTAHTTLDLGDVHLAQALIEALSSGEKEYCFIKLEKALNGFGEKRIFIDQVKEAFTHLQGLSLPYLCFVGVEKFAADFSELNAFLKSLAKESKIRFRSCLYDQSWSANEFINQIRSNPFVVDYRIKDGQWSAKSYIKKDLPQSPKNKLTPKAVMVVGGHRGLGYELLKKGIFSKETVLVVVGRSEAGDQKVSKNIQKLQKKYKIVKYYSGDARSSDFMDKILSENDVEIVINSAGLEFSRLLVEKDRSEIELEYETKFAILNTLMKLETQYSYKVVNFSSVAAEFGNAGQTVYAMASSYQASNPKHLNIFWPPLERVGMTENLGILMKLKEAGLGLLPIDQAAMLFKKLLLTESQGPQLIVSPSDLFLYDVELSLEMSLFKALGYLIDPKSAVFMKTFSTETDRYVLDHVIEQMPVIPASYQLAAMMILAGGYFKNTPDLLNFSIKNIMLMVDGEDLKSFTAFDLKDERNLKATVLTQMEHFSAVLAADRENPQEQRSKESFDLDLICDKFYSPECVGFGPKMQVLKTAHFNTQNESIIGFAEPEKFYLTGSPIVDLWMSSFEVAFQVMALKGIMIGKGLCIPLSLDSVQISRVPRGRIRFQVELHEVYKENDMFPMRGTIRAYDEENRICFKMNNVMMSKIRHFDTIPFDSIAKDIKI